MRTMWVAGWMTVALQVGCAGDDASNRPATEGETGAAPGAPAPYGELPFSLTPNQEQGRLVYETICWTCHGPAGRGDGPAVRAGSVSNPPDFTTGDYPDLTAAQLRRRFRKAMDGADPTHPHMRNVLSFMAESAFTSALSYIPALGYPAEVPGSARAGGVQYRLRCRGCHGDAGDGNGPAAHLSVVQPASFLVDTLIEARDFEGLFRRIREGGATIHGSSMPAWGILLSEGEIWDLVAFLGSFQEGVLSTPPGT